MKKRIMMGSLLAILGMLSATAKGGAFADAVVSYTPGSGIAANFSNPASALAAPTQFLSGAFGGAVSPFNPPYNQDSTSNLDPSLEYLTGIGPGGQLTLRLSNFADLVGTQQLGFFGHTGIADENYPNGQAGSPAFTFGANNTAQVEVSANGVNWPSLGLLTLSNPTNGYTDLTDPYSATPGIGSSDFGSPFSGAINDFDGLNYSQMLTLLNGSGGGNWYDFSSTGLSEVGYVRFTNNSATPFYLDAVAVANDAIGAPTPEPATIVLGAIGLLAVVWLGRRKEARATRVPRLAMSVSAAALLLGIGLNGVRSAHAAPILSEDFATDPV
ncbi:MAG TPA: PEP-CTERM sorting domain-containing protein, partial [Pirellulales bacterium]|nr:PEP-CTERM sorting domain-containing protein [Pirellulales bacterium]